MARYAVRDPEVWQWVLEKTGGLPDGSTVSERLWCAINGVGSRPTCDRGSQLLFNTLTLGYRPTCGVKRDCACARERQSQLAKRMKAEGRLGGSWAETLKDPAASRAKGRQTSLERYGGVGLGSPVVAEKIRSTIAERYGVDHFMRSGLAPRSDMAEARRASFADENPLVTFRDRAKRTMLERYGVESPQQSPEIRERTRQTCLERFGHDTHLKDPAVISRAVLSRRIAVMSGEAVSFLDDSGRIAERIAMGQGPREVAIEFGVSYVTMLRAFNREGYENTKRSAEEAALAGFVRSLGLEIERNRRVLTPDLFPEKRRPGGARELDVVVPSRMVAIEYCGLFPHSIGGSAAMGTPKDPWYHHDKMTAASRLGYRLVTVFSDEWVHGRERVESRLRHVLGLSPRGASGRECEISFGEWSEVREFLDRWHVQGAGPRTPTNVVARHRGEIVGAMTFSRRGRVAMNSSDRGPELVRFCTDGSSHPGLASRMFAAFVRREDPETVISYADRRWSSGGVYSRLGFEVVNEGKPGYFYTDDYSTRRHRFSLRKDVLVGMGGDPSKTEKVLAEEAGFDRIYDCGSLSLVWRR
jgi:hypothetical protein